MSEEKTITETESEGLDRQTVKKLNEYNPIGTISDNYSDSETLMRVESVHIPCTRRLISNKNPEINLVLSHEDVLEDIKVNVSLDRLSDDECIEGDITMSDLLLNTGLSRDNFDEIIGKELSVTVSDGDSLAINAVTGLSENANTEMDVDSRVANRIDKLQRVWSAQEEGKAKIITIEENNYSDTVRVFFEVPWCETHDFVTFTTSTNSPNPSLSALYETVTGEKPISNEDYKSLVGKEIDVSYEGEFGLDESVKRSIENREYDFNTYIKDNKDDLINVGVKNITFSGIIYLLPPFMIVPFMLAGFLSSISILLAFMSVILILVGTGAFITYQDAKESYKRGEKITFRRAK